MSTHGITDRGAVDTGAGDGGLARVDAWVATHGTWVVVAVAAVLLVEQWWEFGRAGRPWDWPSVSAGVTVALTLPFALRVAAESGGVVDRLARRGVLVGPVEALGDWLAETSGRWARWFGVGTAVVICSALVAVWGVGTRTLVVVFAAVVSVLSGRALGRLVATSRLGAAIQRDDELRIEPQPGHVDGVAGLGPVGDHYFRQAMVLAVPALWLAVRLSLPAVPLGRWREVYVGLLVVVVALEVVAFVVPMLAFHRMMAAARRDLLREADDMSRPVRDAERAARDTTDDEERRRLRDTAALLRARIESVETMSTWPLAVEVRRRFTVRNALLLVPAVLNAIGIALPNTDLVETIAELFQ